jgi:hypothetical protein
VARRDFLRQDAPILEGMPPNPIALPQPSSKEMQ